MTRYSLRTLLLIVVVVAVTLAAARLGLRWSQARWSVVYTMPRATSGSLGQTDFDIKRANFDAVIVPWMNDRGYVRRRKPGPRDDGIAFDENLAGPHPRGIRISYVDPYLHFRDNFIEVELWDYRPYWRWESPPPITPTDDERKLIGELQTLLELHFRPPQESR